MEVSVAEAAVADRKRREVEVAEAAAVAERKKIAATRRDIDERRRIEVAQLALLARASDYRAVLDLRLVGDSFAIGPNGLTEEDRAAPDLAALGAQLVLDQATHDARVAAHQRVIAHLDQRRAALNADEARLVASATAAVAAREAAAGTRASADAILQDHRRWAEVVDVLEAQPRWVEVGANTGLPAAVECLTHDLIVAVTPITAAGLFDPALLRCAATRSCDVVLVRHGFHPESIDPVRVDIALHSLSGPFLLTALSFFRHRDRSLHLVPDGSGLGVKIGRDGAEIATGSTWKARSGSARRHEQGKQMCSTLNMAQARMVGTRSPA